MVKMRQEPRAYSVLEDQGTRPRTQYLARLEQGLASAGAHRVYLAGRPGRLEGALKQAGVEDCVYAGCDALATLRAAHDILGTNAAP